ncbi:hypothetical protein [Agaribacterium sp. ZY112]|uniref:hypothetical protein n=1 Tax=Agaribacterium sp. ZY112 TaxID=3233574 RepID=UPI0035243ABB
MKKLTKLLALGLFSTVTATSYACDESCMREQVKSEKNIEFPSYLTWEYCEGLRHDFITTDMQNLQSYSTTRFNTRYKGPIKNIVQLIDQRKDWLGECDTYFSATKDQRIFNDKKTTDAIFKQMDNVKEELVDVINGARYSSENGDETVAVVGEKFEALFQLVDNHNNLMHLRGSYVYQ